MELPLFKDFTEDQRRWFGPAKQCEVLDTERHVYTVPFLYTNVQMGNFYEIDPDKGVEFKADEGFLTLHEEQPIVAVTVVGSGCTRGGYNYVEWWDDDESIDRMKNQLVKRQRAENLNGIHPSIWLELIRQAPWVVERNHTFENVTAGEIKDAVDIIRRLTRGYTENLEMTFHENTATFRVGPPYPKRVTVRCGCKGTEDEGTSIARYPADYAIRVVETTVVKPPKGLR